MLKLCEEEVRKSAKSKSRLHNLVAHQRFIVPFFRGKDIRDANYLDIETFYIRLLGKCATHNYADGGMYQCGYTTCPIRTPLSSRYIQDILDTLRGIFIKYRPNDIPQFPKFTVIPTVEKQRLGIAREISVLDKVPQRHGYRIGILMLLRSGMRINELPAIKVQDCIDGTVFVDKAFSDGKLKLARKSGGEVEYPLSPELWIMLTEHLEGKGPDEFVFSIDGKSPIPPARWYKVWRKACSDAKVKYICLKHASRHSTASRIMKKHKKDALREIAVQLGHNNLTTGEKHYVIEGRGGMKMAREKGDANNSN